MIPSTSRKTIFANISQQLSSILILLILPNFLSKQAFSETIFIATIFSFIVIADLGFSQVYSRIIPAMNSKKKFKEIEVWDCTLINFGLLFSSTISFFFSVLYFIKFDSAFRALLFLPLMPLNFLINFNVTKTSSLGDFSAYKKLISIKSILSLTIIPFSFFFGVTGWLLGTLFPLIFLVAYSRNFIRFKFPVNFWNLLSPHLKEGLIRSVIGLIWVQLLNLGRLFASFNYSINNLAEYGVSTFVYQSLSAIIISAYLPVTVETLKRFGLNKKKAISYALNIPPKLILIFSFLIIIASELSPFFFRYLFPSYKPEPLIQAIMISSLLCFPFFLAFGNCFIGGKKFIHYIISMLFGFTAGWLISYCYGNNIRGAAYGQYFGLIIYTLTMILYLFKYIDVPFRLRMQILITFFCSVAINLIYLTLRW
jgi:hypothetical protein